MMMQQRFQYCHHFGFSTLVTLQRFLDGSTCAEASFSVTCSSWVKKSKSNGHRELLLYFFYLILSQLFTLTSPEVNVWGFHLQIGGGWLGKQCKMHVESASSHNFEGSSPSAEVQQIHSKALLGSKLTASHGGCHFHPGMNNKYV